MARGVWIRPFGKLLYLMPPYIIEETELSQLIAALEFTFVQTCNASGSGFAGRLDLR